MDWEWWENSRAGLGKSRVSAENTELPPDRPCGRACLHQAKANSIILNLFSWLLLSDGIRVPKRAAASSQAVSLRPFSHQWTHLLHVSCLACPSILQALTYLPWDFCMSHHLAALNPNYPALQHNICGPTKMFLLQVQIGDLGLQLFVSMFSKATVSPPPYYATSWECQWEQPCPGQF